MDGPAVLVLPIEGKDIRLVNKDSAPDSIPAQTLHLGSDASAPSQALPSASDASGPSQALHEVPVEHDNNDEQRSLKQIVNPDSLYKYTNWEDPARTIGSYIGVISILCGAHYLPLTKTALKVGATVLGVTATVEYAHRSFTPNTILARLRPEHYKKIPEPVINDTLKDVHDLVQYLVVEAQKIVLGQHLDKTFIAFITLAALYWLVTILSPFALVLLGVTALYAAPLVRSRRGREVIEDARLRAADLGNAALENSQALAQDGKVKAAELTSKAQETAADTKRRLAETATDAKRRAEELAQIGSQTAADAKRSVEHTATDATRRAGELAQSGTEAGADVSRQVGNKVSDVSGAVAENASHLPQLGRNAVNQASNTASQAANQVSNSANHAVNQASNTANQAANQVSSSANHAANNASNTANRAANQVSNTANSAANHASNTANRAANQASNTANHAANHASNAANRTSGNANQQSHSTHNTYDESSPRDGRNGNASGNGSAGVSRTIGTTPNFSSKVGTSANEHIPEYANIAGQQPPAYNASRFPGTGVDASRHTSSTVDGSDSHYALKSSSDGLKDVTDLTPRQNASTTAESSHTLPSLASGVDQAGTHGIMGRSRGVPLADLDGAPAFGKHGTGL